MSNLKSRPPAKKAQNLDNFISGAEDKTSKAKSNHAHEMFPWENSDVRPDILKIYNLRLSEPYFFKLKYIAENTPDSMQKFCINVLEKEIDKKIEEIKGK